MNPFERTPDKSLRLWPGVAIAALTLIIRVIAPLVPDGSLIAVLAPLAGGALIVVWWLFLSRVRWTERLGVAALLIAAGAATYFFIHPSIRGGLMGNMFPLFFAIPGLALALVVWAAATRRLGSAARFAAFAVIVIATCGLFVAVRTDGLLGGVPELAWRWTPTAEDRLLAQAPPEPAAAPSSSPATAPPATPVAPAKSDVESTPAPSATTPEPRAPAVSPAAASLQVRWPGFRGPGRDGVVRGVQIATDWTASPPVAIWKHPVGPGWSSFAVAGGLFYTQEQRGDHEVVSCYRLSTGEPVWMHKDAVRFYESNGGPGPRGTPTVNAGRVFALGATGILNALDAATGARLWSHATLTDTGVKLPGWGITSSPLVVDDLVVVATSGALVAYELETGARRWVVKSTGGSYSSPHFVTLGGVPQILLLAGSGLTSVAPADGAVLWRNAWEGVPIVQPTATADGDILFTSSDAMGGYGARRLAVSHEAGGWKVDERWTSNGLKPYFSDYVVHKGHAYGFDGTIMSCIDLADGKRKWKGGRYGSGQVVLLADQDLLLVISEEGELALVKAVPDQFTEIAGKTPVIEGRTWNHPVIVGDVLLVRNGEEMAAFRLPAAAAHSR
ncbi:MAG TPA: PQQ-binding-like beta-propeller repeat protein [Vicinamibacterales bacterium]|nr:PQQ-binding-like beta-propeller repeat protein [Vicinamibacterales bacterium]